MDLEQIACRRHRSDDGSLPASAVNDSVVESLKRTTSLESSEEGSSFSTNSGNGKCPGSMTSSSEATTDNGKDDHGVGGGGNGKREGKSQKDDSKLPKQVQLIARSVKSLKRSVGKKLRRTFCVGAKTLGDGDDVAERRSSDSMSSPVTSRRIITIACLQNPDFVLCARLLHKRREYQEEMIQNYLTTGKLNYLTTGNYI